MKPGSSLRFSRWTWAGLVLSGPALALLVLHLATGFGLRDAQVLGRYLRHQRSPAALAWQAPASQGNLVDFAVLGESSLVAVREGGFCLLADGLLRPLGPSQGLLRLFPDGENRRLWAAGTYHRVLAGDESGALRHLLSAGGAVRQVLGHPEGLVVGAEGNDPGSGEVRVFRHRGQSLFEPAGDGLSVGMDRWSGFDLSPDGGRILANLPGGKGVGVWSTKDGRMLASWPAERLARILCFLDGERVLFDRGPVMKGAEAAYADAGNRLLLARVGASEEPRVVAEAFATVLSSTCWPDRTRMAFSDMEGLVRVVALGAEPRLTATFAPRHRGIPWRLRAAGKGVWVLLKGEEVRLERFEVE